MNEDLTLWGQRVLVTYNDNNTNSIVNIRNLSAQLIDLLEEHKNKRENINWEIIRVYANAMTEIEWACMWAIKAICK